MLDSDIVIILVLVLIVLYLAQSYEAFSCYKHNSKKILNYNRCYNDPEGCTVMVGINGNSFCTLR